jgi:hypothetical protein
MVDRVLLDVLLKCLHIEPQRSTDPDAGDLPQPGLFVDRVHFKSQELGSLPDRSGAA